MVLIAGSTFAAGVLVGAVDGVFFLADAFAIFSVLVDDFTFKILDSAASALPVMRDTPEHFITAHCRERAAEGVAAGLALASSALSSNNAMYCLS